MSVSGSTNSGLIERFSLSSPETSVFALLYLWVGGPFRGDATSGDARFNSEFGLVTGGSLIIVVAFRSLSRPFERCRSEPDLFARNPGVENEGSGRELTRRRTSANELKYANLKIEATYGIWRNVT